MSQYTQRSTNPTLPIINQSDLVIIKGTNWTNQTIKGNANDISIIKGSNWTDETIKGNADDITELKGTNWSNETIKNNADDIITLNSTVNNTFDNIAFDSGRR